MNEENKAIFTFCLHLIGSTVFLSAMLGINLSWDFYWLFFTDEPNFISSFVILFITLLSIFYFVIVWFFGIGSVLFKLGIWKESESTEKSDNSEDLADMKTIIMTESRKNKLESVSSQLNVLSNMSDNNLKTEVMVNQIDKIKDQVKELVETLDDISSDVDIALFEMSMS